MEELAAGLWRWSAPHPRWRPGMDGPGGWARDVNSVAVGTGDALVLIDPLVEEWDTLDALVGGREVTVVLAAAWHFRSSDAVTARYGAEVLVHVGGTERAPHARTFVSGEVAPGVVALPLGDEGEVLLWLAATRALVSADALTGSADGLRVAESPVLRSREALDEVLLAAAGLEPELVLPAHGPPVLRDGSAEILRALDRPPW